MFMWQQYYILDKHWHYKNILVQQVVSWILIILPNCGFTTAMWELDYLEQCGNSGKDFEMVSE